MAAPRPPASRSTVRHATSTPSPEVTLAAATTTHVQGRFRITTRKLPISKAGAIDAMVESLGIPNVPEMIFGDNVVVLEHVPSGWRIEFAAVPALDLVDKTGRQGLLQVAYAGDWRGVRERQMGASFGDAEVGGQQTNGSTAERPTTVQANGTGRGGAATTAATSGSNSFGLGFEVHGIVKPYDWSYSTTYCGDEVVPQGSGRSLQPSTTAEIPIELLKRRDPILFFDEVMLYESELDDNGISVLSVKVRVHERRMLLLCRLFMRLDGVVLRVRDTRVYVDFETDEVIREYTSREDRFENVKRVRLTSCSLSTMSSSSRAPADRATADTAIFRPDTGRGHFRNEGPEPDLGHFASPRTPY